MVALASTVLREVLVERVVVSLDLLRGKLRGRGARVVAPAMAARAVTARVVQAAHLSACTVISLMSRSIPRARSCPVKVAWAVRALAPKV
jgi:hypothetical protein